MRNQMINLRELRLNNWVYSLEIGEYVQISSIHSEFVTLKDHVTWDYVYADMIKQIPLTEEILLKCGFEKTYYGYKYRNGSTLNFVLKNNEISLGYFDDDDWCGIGKPIKHLHKLQNLIYSLTGEELNIEL